MTLPVSELPDLSDAYALAPEKIAAYQRDGHVCLRGVASREEVSAYEPFITETLERNKKEHRKLAERDTYHKAFVQVGNLWEVSEPVRRFVFARRFARIAAELMGVEGVRLYHDQALYKEPGGGATPWHQDQYYWPFEGDQTITLWMPLVDAPFESGSLVFAPGTHRGGPLAQLAISDESAEFFTRYALDRDLSLVTHELRAGDATFHSGWTLHKAPGNATQILRKAMTIIYFADGLRIAEPANKHQPADLARWFPGQKPGEVAASPLNPLLYHRDPERMKRG